MKVVVNLEKKYFYVLFGILVIVLGLLAVNAYTSDLKAGALPSSFGHSVNEIEGTARASYVGCPTNTLPTGWSPNDFVCGAATLYNSNSNVKINEQGICFGSTCKTAWPSSSRPSSVTKYDWQGRTANGGSDNPDQGNTASHDLCFLTKVYSHDDEYNSRLQGCKIEPQGTVGSGPIPWKKNVLGDGGLSYCSAVCINW